MSFRTQIVLWYGAIVLITLLAFRLASTALVSELLHSDLDESLRAEAEWIGRLIEDHLARGIPEGEIVAEVAERSRLAPRNEFIEVWDAEDRVLFRSPNLEGESLRALARPPLAEPSAAALRGIPVRVVVADSPGLAVAVGYPLTDVEAVVENLYESFLYLVPLALVLAGTGGFFLAWRFLHPIEEMERYAERTLALPLDRDLPPAPAGSDDEIGRLLRRIHEIVAGMRENLRRAVAFSSLASHELRTPLAVLRAQMEDVLRPEADQEELRDVLTSTYDEVLRLASVVEGLLDLSTLQSRTMRLDLVRIDAASFVSSCALALRPLCESRGVSLVVDRRASAVFEGDRSRLRQVLFNLVDNALKHTPEGGTVVLGSDAEEETAVLTVADDGSGIPSATLERIFDPFYRGGEAGPAGTGLGLTLVRWIVDAHGGSVEVRSRPDEGTRFALRFPRADDPASEGGGERSLDGEGGDWSASRDRARLGSA